MSPAAATVPVTATDATAIPPHNATARYITLTVCTISKIVNQVQWLADSYEYNLICIVVNSHIIIFSHARTHTHTRTQSHGITHLLHSVLYSFFIFHFSFFTFHQNPNPKSWFPNVQMSSGHFNNILFHEERSRRARHPTTPAPSHALARPSALTASNVKVSCL